MQIHLLYRIKLIIGYNSFKKTPVEFLRNCLYNYAINSSNNDNKKG